ncbi:MAG: translation elongation factor Ts [Bacillota bacterium]|nr:translation elongation factor Ts [Bacillota bacterium]
MAEVTTELVKQLRERTGAGMLDCKKALLECAGEVDKAIEFLRQKGLVTVAKKAGRTAQAGVIESYVHLAGRIGVIVEVNCETDFVARSPQFIAFAHDIAMQVAAARPVWLSREEITADILDRERSVQKARALEEGKPEKVVDRIVEGRMDKFFAEACLLEQSFIKDDSITVRDLLNQKIALFGENMQIRRFVRFEVAEPL